MWGPLSGLFPRALQLPTMARQHPSLPPLPPVQSFENSAFLQQHQLGWPSLVLGSHCSHSPSPGRKSSMIYSIFYTQADVRTADHDRQVRKATRGFSKLLYPQPKSFSMPQKPQVSRGQRWPDASCVHLPDPPHGEGQVTCSIKHLVKCFVG